MKSKKPEPMVLELVRGVEGVAIYLNDYRIAGPKPWGGGRIENTWAIDGKDVRLAIKGAREAMKERDQKP